MCQLFTNASERENIAAAIKFVTEKGINSLNKMPNITDEDRAMKEAAILEIMSELVQWFDDFNGLMMSMQIVLSYLRISF